MLNRLDRYLLREVTWTFVAVTGVLLVVLLSNQFARVLGQAAQNDFPGEVVATLIGLTTLQQLTLLVPDRPVSRHRAGARPPVSRKRNDGDERLRRRAIARVPAARAADAGHRGASSRCCRSRSCPKPGWKSNRLRIEALRAAQFGALEPGRFRSFAGGDAVFYAERVDANGELFGVFVQRNVGDKLEIAMAERAVQRGAGQAEQTFVLFDGRRYEGVPGTPTWRVIEFKEHGIPVRLPDFKKVRNREELRSTRELMTSDNPRARAELSWRTAVPVMAVVLMLLAVPLAKLRPRQGRFARVGLAVLVYFVYSNLLATVRVWIEKESPGGQFGLWWVHLSAAAGRRLAALA